MRFIKALCMALVLGAVAVPGAAVAGNEVDVADGMGDSRVSACSAAKRAAKNLGGRNTVSIGSCDCGESAVTGLWECIVQYTVRRD